MDKKQTYRGLRGSYGWLTSTEDYSGTILRLCPEVVIGRYLAVTSVDSGTVRLEERQKAAGWESRRGIAYSPRLCSIDEIPHQFHGRNVPGYDEFYTFQARCDIGERSQGNIFLKEFAPGAGRTVVFVNWLSFVLHDPDPAAQTLVDLFWPQLERLQPESYIADGRDCLTFVSRNLELLDVAYDRLVSAPRFARPD
jgi:hypothetical protein